MKYIEFFSDMNMIRNVSRNIVKNITLNNPHFSLTILEGQISEIIKNAVKHGNKCDARKKVKIWYLTSDKQFKIIVEDEGKGFTNFNEWNEFNKLRNEALKRGNIEEMLKYVQYKGPESRDDDGGNSLFAALEYWDSSLVYNNKKNKVAAVKYLF
ncbi:MAG: ATP-binding protein [bacterium]|nr:ATP-binding protein [bacterium]